MLEQEGSSCSSCGYPSYAGHGSECQAQDSEMQQTSEQIAPTNEDQENTFVGAKHNEDGTFDTSRATIRIPSEKPNTSGEMTSEVVDKADEDITRKRRESDQRMASRLENSPEERATEKEQSPEERYKKFENFKAHKKSAEVIIKTLQDTMNQIENIDNNSTALDLFEIAATNLTQRAMSTDIESLRGQSVDLDKEKIKLGIEDEDLDDYNRIRESQNALNQDKPIQDVLSDLENELSNEYGLEKINFRDAQTLQDLNALKINFNLFAEATDNPELVGKIKEIKGIGYHIPDVPLYNVRGKIIGSNNKDVKARSNVTIYKTG